MRSRNLIISAVLAGMMLSCQLGAQDTLRETLKDVEIASHWIYDDLPAAIAQAKTTGKPLLVVLRCVPCPPGRALDTQVMKPDSELAALEKNFVCVRVIQAEGLDLRVFQYDYDMSWAAMFMNADQTIYGRYGTRTASGPNSDMHLSRESFIKALERALELHKAYPGNKESLVGKTGKPPEYQRPEDIPGLQERAQGPTTRQTCIHCHMVKEFAMRAKWQDNRLSPTDLWVYPMPDQIGLTIDSQDGRRVRSVKDGSPAAKAELSAGDELLSLNRQPLVSLADIQWVLHNSPNDSSLEVSLRRNGQVLNKTLELKGNWKQSDIAWRASSWYGLRQGLQVELLNASDRTQRGLAADSMALLIKGLFGRGAEKLKGAGLRVGDVIVGVDGRSAPVTVSEFLADLRLQHGPQDSVKLTILRDAERWDVTVAMW
jgi:hypothetical protein